MELTSQLDHSGPKPPVNVGDASAEESANKNVGGIAKLLQNGKDLMTFGVGPPTSLDGFARNGFRQARHRTLRGYQHHAVLSHERHGRICVHSSQSPITALAWPRSIFRWHPMWFAPRSVRGDSQRRSRSHRHPKVDATEDPTRRRSRVPVPFRAGSFRA